MSDLFLEGKLEYKFNLGTQSISLYKQQGSDCNKVFGVIPCGIINQNKHFGAWFCPPVIVKPVFDV
jgi:hypothetical protein